MTITLTGASEKVCTSCLESKRLGSFHKTQSTFDGRNTQCADCVNGTRRMKRNGKFTHSIRKKTGVDFFRQCSECKLFMEKAYFYTNSCKRSSGFQGSCKECTKAMRKKYYFDNKEEILERERVQRWQLRLEVVSEYGGKCECCGEMSVEFLTIDHIKGGGTKHREEIGSNSMYKFLKKNGFPKDDYRLLCFNCNCARGSFGYCPHQKERAT